MKKRASITTLILSILLLSLVSSAILQPPTNTPIDPIDETPATQDSPPIDQPPTTTLIDKILPDENNQPTTPPEKPTTNPWNETIIISPTWQTLIGTFFGLNLKNVSTEVSVRESIVLISIFVMFFVIIQSILALTPFFKTKIGLVKSDTIAALIITTLVSISGALINLKDLFLNVSTYITDKLNWGWMNTSGQSAFTSFITALLLVTIFVIIWEIFDWLKPELEKYSQISRAQAKGRRLNSAIQNN